MNEETNLIIQEYSKNPLKNLAMKDYTVKQHEGNFICWDDITVYLKIENNTIIDYSFDGNCSNITTAAASFLSELIIEKPIQEVSKRNYNTIAEQGFKVSAKRKRSAVIAILATRNAIHKHLQNNKKDSFDDLIDN